MSSAGDLLIVGVILLAVAAGAFIWHLYRGREGVGL